MGLYDELECEYPLPDGEVQDEIFQTKSLNRALERYTLTADGRLIWHRVRYEPVPEAERPYYGTPEWDASPLRRWFGAWRAVPVREVAVAYHGDIVFYTGVGSPRDEGYAWYEYRARFTEGRLQGIRRVAPRRFRAAGKR